MGVTGWGLILWALLGQTAAPDAAEWTRRLAAHPELADGIRLARGQARLAAGDRAGARADAEAVFA
ncbi:MAG: hypothetical protein KC613_24435, partial [Myxococcales bacterium]|nr:hypothetical protein [Myxococcales bacterium]